MATENGTENGATSANDKAEQLQQEINQTHDALNQVDSLLVAGIATLERSEWDKSDELGALLYLLQMTRRKVVDILDPPTAQEVAQ